MISSGLYRHISWWFRRPRMRNVPEILAGCACKISTIPSIPSLTVRLHHVFHVNNLRPCSIAPLRPDVPVPVPEGDDEEFDVSHISVVCIKSLHGRQGKYMLFMTHFNDDDIPHVWQRLNEVHRSTAAQRYKISWRRPNGTSLPKLRRTSTSCTLIQRAFLSPNNCFSKGA
jgi:hypothetical protein